MDKYDVVHDYYCYSNFAVLKNKLNITDAHVFEQAERDITSLTIERVTYQAPPYHLPSGVRQISTVCKSNTAG